MAEQMDIIMHISPGKTENDFKNQDRADFFHDTENDIVTAVLCDGASTSWYSEIAAEYVASNAVKIFNNRIGLTETVEGLKLLREEAVKKIEVIYSDPKQIWHKESAIENTMRSYMTTIVGAQWQRGDNSLIMKKVLHIGDSAVFIFDMDGNIIYSNLINNSLEQFSGNTITKLIPDHYNDKVHLAETSYNEKCCILLCSDGFYEAFNNFSEIFLWLKNNINVLKEGDKINALMVQLHNNLSEKNGDDDISFIFDPHLF